MITSYCKTAMSTQIASSNEECAVLVLSVLRISVPFVVTRPQLMLPLHPTPRSPSNRFFGKFPGFQVIRSRVIWFSGMLWLALSDLVVRAVRRKFSVSIQETRIPTTLPSTVTFASICAI